MSLTRTRPVADGVVVGLPVSLFYVTAPRSHPWRPPRPTPPLVDWTGVIDLRDDPDRDPAG